MAFMDFTTFDIAFITFQKFWWKEVPNFSYFKMINLLQCETQMNTLIMAADAVAAVV